MTLQPPPLRERARLALALTALGLSVLVAGPATTEARKGEPAKRGSAQAAPVTDPSQSEATARPGEQEPAAEPAPAPAARRGETKQPSREQTESSRGKNTPSSGAKAPGREKNQPSGMVASPEQPAAEPSEVVSEPAAGTEPASPAPDGQRLRHLSTRGPAGVRNARGGRARPGSATPAGSVADATAGTAAAADDRFDTFNAGSGSAPEEGEDAEGGSPVTRTVEQLVEVVPESVGIALAGLLALSLVLAGASLLSAANTRRLARQRHQLLQEVGLLQGALLPPVPEQLGALRTSVAYRPADGPGAGGDFYDALPLAEGRVAFILGDVSGHGRSALERTAFLRYTLRAYLEAGLEPRAALQVGGRVIDQHLTGDFATVVLAIHDPATASLTFACAGHPAPIVVGPSKYGPVLPGASPPLGLGLRTGLRQTTIPLAPGSVVCLFTDGLTEARTQRGILGRPRLGDIVEELGRDATATDLLEHVATEARLVTDDMAAVLFSPTTGVTAGGFRSEQLELSADELGTNVARRFLEACAVEGEAAARAELEAAEVARRFGGAVLNVSFSTREPSVDVLPRNVESIEASSRRSATAS